MKDKRIKDVTFVIFDTETTGLDATSYIVEIGAVKIKNERLIGTFSSLVRPPVPIPRNVASIHGITDEVVRDAPSFGRVIDKFLEFAKDAVLVAHNAPFDMKILAVNLLRAGRKLIDNPVLDTCRMTKNLFPGLPSYSLKFLARYWRSPYRNFHRALPDAQHTAYIFMFAMKKCGIDPNWELEKLMKMFGPPLSFSKFSHIWRPEEPKNLTDFLIMAAEREEELEITYENGGELKKIAIPLNLFVSHGRWYLKALCPIYEKEMIFRVDRIKEAKPVRRCL